VDAHAILTADYGPTSTSRSVPSRGRTSTKGPGSYKEDFSTPKGYTRLSQRASKHAIDGFQAAATEDSRRLDRSLIHLACDTNDLAAASLKLVSISSLRFVRKSIPSIEARNQLSISVKLLRRNGHLRIDKEGRNHSSINPPLIHATHSATHISHPLSLSLSLGSARSIGRILQLLITNGIH